MNALEIINQLKADHITLALSNNGKLDISGNKEKIGQMLPFIRDHKNEIVNLLGKGTHSVRTLPDEPETTTANLEALKISDDSARLRRPTHSPKVGNRIPPFAVEWLKDHRQELRRNGWTMAELYRRNKNPGIAWVAFWDRAFLKVYLHDEGVIEFEAVDAIGKDIIQTARPLKAIHRSKI